jgi:hypothetical protein
MHVADLRRPSSSSRALPRRFQDRREAGSKRALRFAPSVHPRDRDCPHAAPCGSTWQQSGRLPSCLDRPGCPGRRPHGRFLVRMRCVESHTVLTSESPPRASARWCGVLLGQRRVADLPCGSSCGTTRDASDRLLPTHVSSYEHPRRVGSRCVLRLRACESRGSPASHQSDSLRWATHSIVSSPRWAFSSRRDACEPSLWHLCRLSHGCHVARATCASVGAAETTLGPIA